MNKNIMIGMCIFNRKYILDMCASSLKNVKDINEIDLRLYDDCSTEFDQKYLREIFPNAKKIYVSENNRGADKNGIIMLKDFLSSSNEWLFIADSDLIFSKDLISKLKEIMDDMVHFNFESVVSVFNAITHREDRQLLGKYVEKEKLGAAAVILHRKTAQIIIETNNEKEHYDNCFSKVLRERKYKLLCTQRSYVQHIGIEGYNSFFDAFDWGKNFEVDTLANAQIIEKIIDLMFSKIEMSNNKSVYARIKNDINNNRIGLKGLFKAIQYCLKHKIKSKKL